MEGLWQLFTNRGMLTTFSLIEVESARLKYISGFFVKRYALLGMSRGICYGISRKRRKGAQGKSETGKSLIFHSGR